jgi:hypothetical protein
MPTLSLSQSTFGFDLDARALLFAMLLLAASALVVPVSSYCITQRRLYNEHRWAIDLSKSEIPFLKAHEDVLDPQSQQKSVLILFYLSVSG